MMYFFTHNNKIMQFQKNVLEYLTTKKFAHSFERLFDNLETITE